MKDHPCLHCQYFDWTEVLASCGDFVRIPICTISGRKELTLTKCKDYHIPEYLEQMMSNTNFEVKVRFFGEKQK